MVQVAGLVLRRQRPASAKGVLFLTLEDETGLIDVIVRPEQLSAHKWALMQASWLIISGMVQRDEARVAVLFHGVIRQ